MIGAHAAMIQMKEMWRPNRTLGWREKVSTLEIRGRSPTGGGHAPP